MPCVIRAKTRIESSRMPVKHTILRWPAFGPSTRVVRSFHAWQCQEDGSHEGTAVAHGLWIDLQLALEPLEVTAADSRFGATAALDAGTSTSSAKVVSSEKSVHVRCPPLRSENKPTGACPLPLGVWGESRQSVLRMYQANSTCGEEPGWPDQMTSLGIQPCSS